MKVQVKLFDTEPVCNEFLSRINQEDIIDVKISRDENKLKIMVIYRKEIIK